MDSDIRYIKGIGPKREKLLNRLGIFSLHDLFYYFPVRYEDRRNISFISSLKEGDSALIKAKVSGLSIRKGFYGRKSLVQAVISDDTGVLISIWFNQPYICKYLKSGNSYYFYGRIRRYKNKLQIVSPEFEESVSSETLPLSGIIPCYSLTQGITQNALRKIISFCLKHYSFKLSDPIPFKIRKEYNFPNIAKAVFDMHFPGEFPLLREARKRFIFEEFFMLQILLFRRKAKFRMTAKQPVSVDPIIVNKVKENFGYPLTSAQEKAVEDILKDLSSSCRSARLLQGDVGSGKTIVASIACFAVVSAGGQCAFMVPTEVLAFQHKMTLEKLAKGTGINIEILTSSISSKKRKDIYRKLSEGSIQIIVGTHALLNQDLKFKDLRLAVIDEQHRFGVSQRAVLVNKGAMPDVLVMSATPIPRSLALTLYGDLELTFIREYPKDRKVPLTEVVGSKGRAKVYEFVKRKVREGRQAYIIYALVDESDETGLYSAVQMYGELKKMFKDEKLGLLHGRLSADEKQKVLEDFRNKEIDILVSTLVVEVGVDVPNAAVMVVENPERFGLAQLHQLRGRIMRSGLQPFFFMVASINISSESRERLKILESTNDGFKIAEEDLRVRGPGDLFGTVQAGYLPKRIASVQEDSEMLQEARKSAFQIIKKDPELKLREHSTLLKNIETLMEKSMVWQAS